MRHVFSTLHFLILYVANSAQLYYVSQIIYVVVQNAAKLSILLLYLRIFPGARFRLSRDYASVSRRRGRGNAGFSLYALTFPLGALILAYMLLRSTLVTLRQGGIIWRDTFYPLDELKRGAV